MNARLIAVEIITKVLAEKRSLSQLLSKEYNLSKDDQALLKELVYGVIRWFFLLKALSSHFLKKELRSKDLDIQVMILLGLYQLLYMRIPQHAAVYETVKLTKMLKKPWAKALVNAVLQNFLREKITALHAIESIESAYYSHPEWLIAAIKTAWPTNWQAILLANNEKPPMSLRINCQKTTREKYQSLLKEHNISSDAIAHTSQGIQLEHAKSIESLPHFFQGFVSVQDGAAQLAAELLNLKPHLAVLDACAAPGGKTCHILEKETQLTKLSAVEKDSSRIAKIYENLQRLDLKADVICADVEDTELWWDGEQFDRILLDAPCSATGVIRRNPDIKILRTVSDISELAKLQKKIIQKLWPLLKPDGILLYATCSILPAENVGVAKFLLKDNKNCQEIPIKAAIGHSQEVGLQILPGENNMDGFYYALFKKLVI